MKRFVVRLFPGSLGAVFLMLGVSVAAAQCPAGDSCQNGGCIEGTIVMVAGACGNCPAGTTVTYMSTGTNGNDCFVGGSGDDTFDGRNGDDFICGNGGADTLSGGGDNDIICGGSGIDPLNGDNGDDYIDGGNDTDLIFGGSGNDTILGGSGTDLIDGQQGDDTIYGEDNDALDDTIIGGPGTDTCIDQPAPTDTTCETATYALVTSASATATGQGTLFRWRTDSEAGTVGFQVLWERGQERHALGSVLPSVHHARGGVYAWHAPGVKLEGGRFVLAEVGVSGVAQNAATFVRGDGPVNVSVGEYVSAPHVSASVRSPEGSGFEVPRTLSSVQTAVRVRAPADTLVELSFADLAAAYGLTESDVAKRVTDGSLSLSRGGKALGYVAEASRIVFALPEVEGDWGLMPTATVSFGGNTAALRVGAAVDASAGKHTALSRVKYEKDVFAATAVPMRADGDVMHWAVLSADYAKYERFETPVSLPGYSAGPVTLTFTLRAASPGFHHHVRVSDGSQDFGVIEVGSMEPKRYSVAIPGGVNLTKVVLTMSEKLEWMASSIVYLDDIEVSYQSAASSAEGSSLYLSKGDVVSQSLVPQSGLWVMEEGVGGLRKLELSEGASFVAPVSGRYFVAGAGELVSAQYAGQDLPSAVAEVAGAELLIIAADGLLSQAAELTKLHAASGLRVGTVSILDVYDEFSAGDANPEAIHRFLTELDSASALPSYMLLLGSGHLDYGASTTSEASQVPPRLMRTRDGLYADDGRHADIDGDGFADLAVGRVTGSAAEVDVYVTKMARYLAQGRDVSAESWKFVADVPFDGADFTAQWQSALGESSIDLETLSQEQADKLMQTLLSGQPVAYLGHGSMAQLGKTAWVTSSNLDANLPLSPFVFAGACTVGRYEIPDSVSIAELLLSGQAGGPLTVWAPSGVSYSEDAARIGAILHEEITSGEHARLGDALMATQARAQLLIDGEGDNAVQGALAQFSNIFELFGDPALPLRKLERAPVADLGSWVSRSTSIDAEAQTEVPELPGGASGCRVGAGQSQGALLLALLALGLVARRRRNN